MKTRITMVMFVALVLSIFCAKAQIAVNGVEVGTKMTKSEVIAKFGKPDRYSYNDAGIVEGIDEWYIYADSSLHFNNNMFIGFTVCDKNFSVTLGGLDSDIAAGDKFSVLSPLDLIERTWIEKDYYSVYYYDECVSFKKKDGLIEYIYYSLRL
nr:hypothetical protein [Bacteroides intestinalis]